MSKFKTSAFIFDMDGTLVDNMRFHTEAWRKLLEENDIEFDEHKFLVETAGKTNREILPGVFGKLTDERLAELALRKEDLYREIYLPVREPLAGLTEFLERSLAAGIRLAVSTAASPRNVEFILDGLLLRQYFSVITTAADVRRGKPDPETFLISADNLGVEPRSCIVFEDAFGGFEAAKRAGMTCIGLTTVNSAEDILRSDAVVEAHQDFTELVPEVLIERYMTERATA